MICKKQDRSGKSNSLKFAKSRLNVEEYMNRIATKVRTWLRDQRSNW